MDIKEVSIDSISAPGILHKNVQVDMLRLDLIHANVSGNKWFKLKENIRIARENGFKKILTFGGAYSNHLYAAAHYCYMENIPIIGIVRGQELNINSNETLNACHRMGMELVFIDRKSYNLKENADQVKNYIDDHTWVIPEGGDNQWGVKGASLIWDCINDDFNKYTHIALSLGSGTTLKGLLMKKSNRIFEVYSSVPDADAIIADIKSQHERSNIKLTKVNAVGNFGQAHTELISFINEFYKFHNIPLDLVYTSKMMYYMINQIQDGYFPESSRILAIHTGGLQGNIKWSNQLIF